MTNGLLLWVDDEVEQLRAHLKSSPDVPGEERLRGDYRHQRH